MVLIKRFNLPIVILMPFLVSSCATVDGAKRDFNEMVGNENVPVQEEVDHRTCAKNFSVSGSFLSGRKYRSYQDFTGISESKAFTKVAQHIATNGWNIINTDKSLGMITATQGVVGGPGKTVPLNVVVKKTDSSNVRVECVYSLSPGLMTSADGVKDGFCQIIESVSN